jgi:4-amino-4-deoxy-L-arabinose transferase-like glycosyltransferase
MGSLFYGKRTGVLAAAFFGLTPWQVFISRTLLIDVQCLFFSLVYLYVGILAIRRNSVKLVFVSGMFFAVALLTKLFSVFMLIPLLLVLRFERLQGFRLTRKKMGLFILPVLISQSVWYLGFANQNFFAVYFNGDFLHPMQAAAPSIFFLPQMLTEALGWFLLGAAIFSLILSVWQRELFKNVLRPDCLCAVTVFGILGLNFLLVIGFNLNVPYISAFKYSYQALPMFCFLAASLANKCYAVLKAYGGEGKTHLLALLVAVAGLAVLSASMVENMVFLSTHAADEVVLFSVDAVTGFPFKVFSAVSGNTYIPLIQLAAFHLIAFSLLLPLIIRAIAKLNRKRKN